MGNRVTHGGKNTKSNTSIMSFYVLKTVPFNSFTFLFIRSFTQNNQSLNKNIIHSSNNHHSVYTKRVPFKIRFLLGHVPLNNEVKSSEYPSIITCNHLCPPPGPITTTRMSHTFLLPPPLREKTKTGFTYLPYERILMVSSC